MLVSGDNYENKKDDFNEINNEISNLGSFNYIPKQNNDENPKKMSKNHRLIMFLIGFSYTGLTVLSILWAIVLSYFNFDATFANMLLEVFVYLTLFGCIFGVALKSKDYFIGELKNPSKYLKGLLWGAITLAAEIGVSILLSPFAEETNANQAVVESLTSSYPTIMFFIIVIIGPICEECTYRVGLYGWLREKNETLGFLLSGFIFAFVHISFTDTTLKAELVAFPVYLTLSYLLTYTYKKHGLAGSVIAHMCLNLVSFLAVMATQSI